MTTTLFKNVQIVLPDQVIAGHILVQDGVITQIDTGSTNLPGIDLEGDYLLPGLVELHTDNLEKHVSPRPNTFWPIRPAVLAHDAQIAAAGITTVFDAIALGDVVPASFRTENLSLMVDGVQEAAEAGLLRADHFLHLRCEVCYPTLPELVADLIERPIVRFASVMDHTPGQRQFTSMEKYASYYQVKHNLSDEAFAEFVRDRMAEQVAYSVKHRQFVVAECHARDIPVASHDDATAAHVAEAERDGLVVAEFPTTVEAARASKAAGLGVMMGAPNVLRGGSHSGNVAAQELAEHGLVDILSSDYVPSSLLPAAFYLARNVEGMDLPAAVSLITAGPAERVGLADRGAIAIARKGDLVRVRDSAAGPVAVAVWKEGERVL